MPSGSEPGRGSDAWGRQLPEAGPPAAPRRAAKSWTEYWIWVILRGLVFVPLALLALTMTVNLGYFGQPLVFVLAQFSLVPAAVVCWVQASVGRAGDRWTVGYTAVWVLEVVLWVSARIF